MKRNTLPGFILSSVIFMTLFFQAYGQQFKATAPGYLVNKSKLLSGIEWIGAEIPYGDTSKRGDTYPRLPLKWFDAEKLEGWLLFSGTWRNYGGLINSNYRAHVRKFRLALN